MQVELIGGPLDGAFEEIENPRPFQTLKIRQVEYARQIVHEYRISEDWHSKTWPLAEYCGTEKEPAEENQNEGNPT